MLWLQFGDRVHAPTRNNPDRITGEYALHVQCPWRVCNLSGIIVGSSDMYIPADEDANEESFEWDVPGNALADVRLAAWVSAGVDAAMIVSHALPDPCGGFTLQMSHGDKFEVFPCV